MVSEIKESLKPILRRATPEDLEQAEGLKKRAVETLKVVRSRAADDGLAMGGTVLAAKSLVGSLGGQVVSLAVFLEIRDLDGRERLNGVELVSLVQC